LFTGESTNSGAVSLSESELGGNGPVNGGGPVSFSCSSLKTKEVSPAVQAALDFMAAGNGLNGEEQKRSTGRELLIFAAMLNDVPYLLATFNALPNNYEERRSALIDVFVSSTCSILLICSIHLPDLLHFLIFVEIWRTLCARDTSR
jgi:hypothetical protein